MHNDKSHGQGKKGEGCMADEEEKAGNAKSRHWSPREQQVYMGRHGTAMTATRKHSMCVEFHIARTGLLRIGCQERGEEGQ